MVIVMAEGGGASSEHNGQCVGTAGVTSVSESGVSGVWPPGVRGAGVRHVNNNLHAPHDIMSHEKGRGM